MKIIVTGSEGNIGSLLVPYLKSQGHEVYGIDIRQRFAPDYMTADINAAADIALAFQSFKPQVVIHLAAMVSRVTSEKSPALTIQTNLGGTSNIIQLCKAVGAKLIFFSTSEIYGNTGGILYESDQPQPNNLYGLSKWLGEQLVTYEVTKGLDALIVRPFMFYHETETTGDHRSAMIRFIYDLMHGNKAVVHKGSVRSWLHLDDGVAIIEKLCHVKGFYTVNVGHPEAVKTEALAYLICDFLGLDFDSSVELTDLPERMTLTKYPSLSVQAELTAYLPKISLKEGVSRVINNLKSRQ
jgi:nucleoside-diphosphate-sugar epimerase